MDNGQFTIHHPPKNENLAHGLTRIDIDFINYYISAVGGQRSVVVFTEEKKMAIVTKHQKTIPLLVRGEDLPYEDGVPLESSWHLDAMYLLISILRYYWRDRNDIYVGGNMFVYFDPDQVKSRNFCGPDFFVIKDVTDNTPRHSWVLWEEDYRSPDFVIELASKTTMRYDKTTKKEIYEVDLETGNYIIYNPETDVLEGWELKGGSYVKLQPNRHGWLWCSELGLWLGTATYEFVFQTEPVKVLRFFDRAGNFIPTPTEAEAKARRVEAKIRQKAEQQAKIEVEARRRETENRQKAEQQAKIEAEARRAAEAEVERLKALLKEQNK